MFTKPPDFNLKKNNWWLLVSLPHNFINEFDKKQIGFAFHQQNSTSTYNNNFICFVQTKKSISKQFANRSYNVLDTMLAQTNLQHAKETELVGASWRMVVKSLFSRFIFIEKKLIHLNAYTFSKWYFIMFRETHRRSHGCF